MIIDTTKMSSRGQVVIPLDMREDIREGDKLIVIRKDNEIILKKSIPESAILSEKSFAKIWLNKKRVPALGCNGFFFRRKIFDEAPIDVFLHPIFVYGMVQKGHKVIAKVKQEIIHIITSSWQELMQEIFPLRTIHLTRFMLHMCWSILMT